jgi:CheY-like chemotaxis protein
MALTSLVVSADVQAVHVLSRILADLGIQVEQSNDSPAALARLQEQAFDALLVDCKDEPAAVELMVRAKKIPANQTTLVVALVDSQNDVREVFAKGANFVLYKPISSERAAHSLRAARSLMRRERRRNTRVALHAEASIAYANIEDAVATLLDLNEEGIAIQAQRRLPPKCKVYFQFSLPGHVSAVKLSGEVMWQDSTGRVGIRFADVPQSSRRVLTEWMRLNGSRHTVSLPPAGFAQPARQRAGDQASGPGLLSVSASDRRGRSRRACTLSADVCRQGSSVPQHCSLSDISPGGCYVETTAPFAAGTAVDILVRTAEMKLQLRGSVQATHPGFGMGVAFSVQTAEEREQVQRLIACQPFEGIAELPR